MNQTTRKSEEFLKNNENIQKRFDHVTSRRLQNNNKPYTDKKFCRRNFIDLIKKRNKTIQRGN